MQTAETLLGISLPASADEIRRAYRLQITRYHPDKVHHLGEEFRTLAAAKSAQLTGAYHELLQAATSGARTENESAPPTFGFGSVSSQNNSATGRFDDDVEWKAIAASCPSLILQSAFDRLIRSVHSTLPRLEELTVAGFAFAATSRPGWRGRLNREPSAGVLVRMVNEPSIAASSRIRARGLLPGIDGPIVVFDLVSTGLPVQGGDRSADRKARLPSERGISVVTVDAMQWNAHIPTDVPEFAYRILECLRSSRT